MRDSLIFEGLPRNRFLFHQDFMEVSRSSYLQLEPRQSPLGQIQQGIDHRLDIVHRSLRLALMRSAAHETQSTNDFALILLGYFTSDGKS